MLLRHKCLLTKVVMRKGRMRLPDVRTNYLESRPVDQNFWLGMAQWRSDFDNSTRQALMTPEFLNSRDNVKTTCMVFHLLRQQGTYLREYVTVTSSKQPPLLRISLEAEIRISLCERGKHFPRAGRPSKAICTGSAGSGSERAKEKGNRNVCCEKHCFRWEGSKKEFGKEF